MLLAHFLLDVCLNLHRLRCNPWQARGNQRQLCEYKKVILESRLHVLGYLIILILSLYFNSWAALTFWILPMLITKPIHQMQNTIEHLGLTHKKDILQNTRSTRTNFLMKWLCWQMPYHTAHHTFPSVPFWKLNELNSKIEKKSRSEGANL